MSCVSVFGSLLSALVVLCDRGQLAAACLTPLLSGPLVCRYLTGMVEKRTLEKYEREAKEKNRETW